MNFFTVSGLIFERQLEIRRMQMISSYESYTLNENMWYLLAMKRQQPRCYLRLHL